MFRQNMGRVNRASALYQQSCSDKYDALLADIVQWNRANANRPPVCPYTSNARHNHVATLTFIVMLSLMMY
jgi:hypothetical protein